jgi:type IV secretory pathway component VirB8
MFKKEKPAPDIILGLAFDKAMKQNRLLTLLNVTLIGLTAILGIAVITILPLKETTPYFVPISKEGKHLYYDIIPADRLGRNALYEITRDYLKRYVINRHTVNNVSEFIAFKRIKAQSSQEVFAQLKAEYDRFKEAMPDVTRDIEIINDLQLEPYHHQVTFKTIDTDEAGKTAEREWMVNIRYRLAGFNAPAIKINAKEIDDNPNPLGLKVIGYTWTKRR